MKKKLIIALLVSIVLGFLFSQSKLYGMFNSMYEGLGCDNTVLEYETFGDSDFRKVIDYTNEFKNNIWNIKYKEMNGNDLTHMNIKSNGKLKVNSKTEDGEMWVKITQGSVIESYIQKQKLLHDGINIVDLSRWEDGEVTIWLVAENSTNGDIKVEFVE